VSKGNSQWARYEQRVNGELWQIILPIDDIREHAFDTKCWCNPIETSHHCWSHNSADGREKYETGERKTN